MRVADGGDAFQNSEEVEEEDKQILPFQKWEALIMSSRLVSMALMDFTEDVMRGRRQEMLGGLSVIYYEERLIPGSIMI